MNDDESSSQPILERPSGNRQAVIAEVPTNIYIYIYIYISDITQTPEIPRSTAHSYLGLFVGFLIAAWLVCQGFCLCHCVCRSWQCQAFVAVSVYHRHWPWCRWSLQSQDHETLCHARPAAFTLLNGTAEVTASSYGCIQEKFLGERHALPLHEPVPWNHAASPRILYRCAAAWTDMQQRGITCSYRQQPRFRQDPHFRQAILTYPPHPRSPPFFSM